MIYLRHLLHEAHEHVTALEHKRVDRDLVTRAARNFSQSFLDRSVRWRVRKLGVGLARFKMRCGLAVRNHDHLAIAPLVSGQELPSQHKAMLHVGPVDPFIPGQGRQ